MADNKDMLDEIFDSEENEDGENILEDEKVEESKEEDVLEKEEDKEDFTVPESKKDEKKEEEFKVPKQIKGFWKRYKKTEAELEKIREEQKELQEANKLIVEHNKQLAEIAKKAHTPPTVDKKEVIKGEIEKLEGFVAEFEEDVEKALKEEDYSKVLTLQNKIRKIEKTITDKKIEREKVEEVKVEKEDEGKVDEKVVEERTEKFQEWKKVNKWYDEEEVLKVIADQLGFNLLKKGMSYEKMLEKVSEDMKKRFNVDIDEKEDDEEKEFKRSEKKKGGFSELGTPLMKKGKRGAESLSADELKACKALRCSPEEYLEQKRIIAKERGEL